MIEKIIRFSIHNKLIIALFILILVGWGSYSLYQLPIDAVPDITNNQVQIISRSPSLAVQEVESIITAPIEVSVANIPDIIELRSISRLGLSVVTVVFKDNVDIYWARQQINEKLREAEEQIPTGLAKIEMAPVSTGLGEIFQYNLKIKKGYENKFTPMDLRTYQDWIVRRQMLGTPGVADVNSYGGFIKQYEVAINPQRLQATKVTINEIFEALEKNNENTGSAYIDKNPEAYFIRGIGLIKSLDDIENIVVKNTNGLPVLIRDVAKVQFGNAVRHGALVSDTSETVGGVVMMLKGANANEVVKSVKEKITSIQKSLPEGIEISAYLDRSELVDRAIGTVTRNLAEGALIVIFILVLLLGNFRAGIIVASVIPLSMLFAISMMHLFGISGNLMSLGAIDFGLIVDGAVIVVESIVHRISKSILRYENQSFLTQIQMDEEVLKASSRIRNAAAFGEIIILIVYLPILALVGIEGKMFRPMGQVVGFAILGAFILSLTWVPMISSSFLSKKTSYKPNFSDRIMSKIYSIFKPLIDYSLAHKIQVIVISLLIFIASLFCFSRLGGEFIPQLEEGDLAAMVITLQGGSPSHTIEVTKQANRILRENFPEIKEIVCKIGPGEIPTDPTPMETGDYIITLKDKSEWTSAETREELVEKIEEKLAVIAGVKFEFQQPIQLRFNELMTGSRQDVAVKLYGNNLDTLSIKADEIEQAIASTEGIEDINVEKITGLAQIQIEYNRQLIAQYGLNIADINRTLRTAFAGSSAGTVFNEEQRFELVVRLDKDFRNDINSIKNLGIVTSNGTIVPLDQLATVGIKTGPAQVSRENTQRRITVGFNVRGRDVESVVDEIQSKIDQSVQLPVGYYIDYGGQFENLISARKRLMIAVPVSLFLIFILLFFTFKSVKQAVLIYTAVPMAAIGGIFALWLRDMNFSISAGVGFIALFGVAVLNGIVLIAEFNRLEKEGECDILVRVQKGLKARFRPVIMTATVASLGFLPMALSTSAGAEVQKPLATVVIGGLITSTLLTLIILPILYIIFSKKKKEIVAKFLKSSKYASVIILLSFISINGYGQDELKISVEKAVQMSLDSSMNIRYAQYNLEMVKALKGASWDIPKTNIEAQYGQFNSYNKDNSILISQAFSYPGVYINQNRLAKAQIEKEENNYKTAQIEVATEVKKAYWTIVYLGLKQKLLEQQDSLFSEMLRGAELKSKLGETNKLEMMNVRSQALEIKNFRQQIESELLTEKSKLKLLIGTNVFLKPIDEIFVFDILPIADTIIYNYNTTLQFYTLDLYSKRIEYKIEKSRLMPDFSIAIFSQTMRGEQEINGIPRVFGGNYRFTGIQAGVSIPLFFNSNYSSIKAGKIRERMAELKLSQQQQQIKNEYFKLSEECKKHYKNVFFYENQALPEAMQLLEQATKSYKAGAIDASDYLIMLNRSLEIRHKHLNAHLNYKFTVIELDQLTGKIY